jgi:hypothetical protein
MILAPNNVDELHLPLAGLACQIVLTFRHKKIVAIEPGQAFDVAEWNRVCEDIERSILAGPVKVGREYSFSSFRVLGSWRGNRSGVQILPPPDDAPRAHVEMAAHPFILEFPIQASGTWAVTNHRRMREHRNLTVLLNVLLAGRTSLQSRRSEHFWACMPRDPDRDKKKWIHKIWQSFFFWSRASRSASGPDDKFRWVQQFFFAKLGEAVTDELSTPAAGELEEVEPEEYYAAVGHDGKGLRVPADLDDSICRYTTLSAGNRAKFDRATFWIDLASRQWNTSVSASFAALVSAIESLTDRGNTHQIKCPKCGMPTQHEVPGATRRFKDFFDTYAPGAALARRRDDMYSLRSGILHGSELMQFDQDLAFGWDPWNELELYEELWGLTRVALRNWLKNPPGA